MVAITNLALLLSVLAGLSAAAPAATTTSGSTPSPTLSTSTSSHSSISSFGGSTALAMQIFVHKITDSAAGQLCAEDTSCKSALQKLEGKKASKTDATQHDKRKIPGLSLFGGPWGLAYSIVMSTDEGQKVQGYAVSKLRGLCDLDETCKEALEGYDKFVAPSLNEVDNVETEAENAVLGAAEEGVKKII